MRRRVRRAARGALFVVGYGVGLGLLFCTGAWVWWQQEPVSPGTATNALWARHQWVGEPHDEREYRDFAALLRANRITDVYFHSGPYDADGGVRPDRYGHASELLEAMRRYAPGVRSHAYLGQTRVQDGHGVLDLDSEKVRARILATDIVFMDLGFDGIHYDIEPVYADDAAFLDLLDRAREQTRARGKLLSVALEQKTLLDAAQPLYRALLPRDGTVRYPPRPTADFLRTVADRVDQLAIMTYDVHMPTRSVAGLHFAKHTEWTLRLVGDRTTVFMGVPTYDTTVPWAETLEVGLRGVRRGLDRLDRPPSRPYGVAVYASWTTTPQQWASYRRGWPPA